MLQSYPVDLSILRCPHDGGAVERSSPSRLACSSGHGFAVDGCVVDFLPPRAAHVVGLARAMVYDALLPRWTLQHLFGVRPALLEELHELAAGAARGGTLVDAPCGSALFSAEAAVRAGIARYVGLDASAPMLRLARRRLVGAGVPDALLVAADLLAPPLAPGSADAVVTSLGLQFVAPREVALGSLARLLRPGGRLYGAAPALGLRASYDRRHQTRRVKDFPLDAATLSDELGRAGFVDVTVRREGALLVWTSVRAAPRSGP